MPSTVATGCCVDSGTGNGAGVRGPIAVTLVGPKARERGRASRDKRQSARPGKGYRTRLR